MISDERTKFPAAELASSDVLYLYLSVPTTDASIFCSYEHFD